jgi:uncharacterized membrane protein
MPALSRTILTCQMGFVGVIVHALEWELVISASRGNGD